MYTIYIASAINTGKRKCTSTVWMGEGGITAGGVQEMTRTDIRRDDS